MAVDIIMTETADKALNQLSASMRRITVDKIRVLAENPRHPSLKVHRVQGAKAMTTIWECYITDSITHS